MQSEGQPGGEGAKTKLLGLREEGLGNWEGTSRAQTPTSEILSSCSLPVPPYWGNRWHL